MYELPEGLVKLITQMTPEQHRTFAGFCAEQVLPIYKETYPHQRDLWEVLTLLRRGVPVTNFSSRLETCWERAFEAEHNGEAHAAAAAFIIVERLELQLMQGSLLAPVLRLSKASALLVTEARTPYSPHDPGYAATFITCMQQQRDYAHRVLRRT